MEVEIIAYNKVLFKGQVLKVEPEVLQDAHHGIIITEEQFSQYITDTYNKEISIVRNNKLKQLGI